MVNNGAQVTSPGSRSFESLAFNSRQTRLYAVPEAAPTVAALRPLASDERYPNFFEDATAMAYTGHDLVYNKDGPRPAIRSSSAT